MEWSGLSLASDDMLGAPPWFWAIFASSITAILIFDLGYLNRRIPVLSLGQSIVLTAAYAVLAAMFGCGAWLYFGPEKGSLFFTAYALEQSLSIDNVFVMSVIFAFFGVPRQYQHRVLFWGSSSPSSSGVSSSAWARRSWRGLPGRSIRSASS